MSKTQPAVPVQPAQKLPRREAVRMLTEQTCYVFKDVSYYLSMTYATMIRWEQLTGLSFFVDAGRIFDRPTVQGLPAMLYSLMVDSGYKGPQSDVMEHVCRNPKNFRAALDAVNASYLLSRLEPDGSEAASEPEDNPPEPTAAE